MNLPNQLTILRVILIPAFLVLLFMDYQYSAISVFLLAAATDWLDGYIARKYDMITNFGKFMDPLADKLLVSAALIAMIELGMLPAWIVIIIISREFIVTGFRLVAADNNIVIAAGMLGKIKTAEQMVMIVYLLMFGNNDIIAAVLVWAAVILTVVSAAEYIIQNRQVLKS